jgi:hypothetical protein
MLLYYKAPFAPLPTLRLCVKSPAISRVTQSRLFYLLAVFVISTQSLTAQPIDRKALVQRHMVVNTRFDTLASLSVGNGRFAFTVDATGLQSFPDEYARGVPLGTQSEWGWHSFKDTAHYNFSETLENFQLNGRKIPYSVQVKEPKRKANAVNWFRQNPHRLQLGNIGMEIFLKNGKPATINDIRSIHQTLDPWTGEIHSVFSVEGIPVEVFTYAHQQQDAIAVKIISSLLQEKRLRVRVRFPYPNAEFKDVGTGWNTTGQSTSWFSKQPQGGIFRRQLNNTAYFLQTQWKGNAEVKQQQPDYFLIQPAAGTSFELVARFESKRSAAPLPSFGMAVSNSHSNWQAFWQSGGAIDLSDNTDPRAKELERRIILSQYLTRIQCAGNYPPQETGLTYNSWYGKPHLEMHWWHAAHFALWGRTALLEKTLAWYDKAWPEAKKIAQRQGYDGIRWQKMTDNEGKEAPSSVGAFLIWQQPHYIYFAEQVYRSRKTDAVLNRYKELLFATADFMASYAFFDPVKKKYILGKGLIPAQERFKAIETFNPPYELSYWVWALNTANQWRERLHLPRNKKWDAVVKDISPLPVQNNKYLFTESAIDSYTNPEFKTDHPSVLGALGMLPATSLVDSAVMRHTFDWIMQNWSWSKTWGWDFPMVAMTATRLGLPDKAVDALLMPIQTNTYLPNGHNYQDERLTIYLPGNGGVLIAAAMMFGGYDGSGKHPGLPAGWKVKTEGLRPMP